MILSESIFEYGVKFDLRSDKLKIHVFLDDLGTKGRIC